MDICSIKYNNINFKAKPIYNINLKQDTPDGTKLVKARFSSISPRDNSDVWTMSQVAALWADSSWDRNYTEYIMDDFNRSDKKYERFFIVELIDQTKALCQRIKSIIEISNPKYPHYKSVDVYFLQAASKNDTRDNIKGAGEQALLGIVKLAKKYKKDSVKLHSIDSAVSFYQHIGFKPIEDGDAAIGKINPSYYEVPFELKLADYQPFIEKVNSRYSQN